MTRRAMVDGAWCTDEEQRVYECAFAWHAGLASPLTIESAMEEGAGIERKRAADAACTIPRGAAVHAVRAWRWAHRHGVERGHEVG